MKNKHLRRHGIILTALAMILGSSAAHAVDVYLLADDFVNDDGVTMWGYAECGVGFAGCDALDSPVLQSPGPEIRITAGDELNIHVRNRLPGGDTYITKETSVIIPGLPKALSPATFLDDAVPPRTRIYSFDAVTPQGADSVMPTPYTWTTTATTPGTYLYHSGTHVQVQMQMGLYGTVVIDTLLGEAYPGVPYAQDKVVLISEVDPAIHEAVTLDNYANPTCDPATTFCPTSTEVYAPRYFYINGVPWTVGSPILDPILTAAQNTDVLLRFANAGLKNHAMQVDSGHMKVIAQDGKVAPTSRYEANLQLPAGKTKDAVITTTSLGTYTFTDRHLSLVTDTVANGGLRARINVVAGNLLPDAMPDGPFVIDEGDLAGVSGNVLTNDNLGDTPTTVTALSQQGSALVFLPDGTPYPTAAGGTLTMDTAGAYTYIPPADVPANTNEVFDYTITDSTPDSDSSTLTVTVTDLNLLPNAMPDGPFDVFEGTAAIPGNVLTNDGLGDAPTTVTALSQGGPLFVLDGTTANATAAGGTLTMDTAGAYSYTPPADVIGDTNEVFDYTITDSNGDSDASTLTVTVIDDLVPVPVLDVNSVNEGGIAIAGNVLANDNPGNAPATVTFVQHDMTPYPLPAVISPTLAGGSMTILADGSYNYTSPPGVAATTPEVFAYAITDSNGDVSANTTLTVTVNNVNLVPTANPDGPFVVDEGGPDVVGNVLTNDGPGDPPTTVTALTQQGSALVFVLDGVTANPTEEGGTLIIGADGAYTYTPPADVPADVGEVFDYTIEDVDTDSDSSTLSITVQDVPVVSNAMYFSTQGSSTVPNVAGPYDDADIYFWDGTPMGFSRVFDASAMGVPGNADITAMWIVDADTFYVSFARNGGTTVGGITAQDEDIVMYDAGTWSMFFDGSDVNLGVEGGNGSSGEDIDAFAFLAPGSIVISTRGSASGLDGFSVSDEDLLRCDGSFGATTSCTWSMYVEGSDPDIMLNGGNDEDVNGASATGGNVYLTVRGNYTTPGDTGDRTDVFACESVTTGMNPDCVSWSKLFDGSDNGITDNIDAIHVPEP